MLCSSLDQIIDGFTNCMHIILTKVIPDNLKTCPRFVQLTYAQWIPSIEIPLLGTGSAVVEDRFLCRHVGSNFISTATYCRQNNVQEINAVMLQPKSKLRVARWIIGTGRVNSGGLSIKPSAALAWQHAFRKQASLFEGLFLLYFVFKCSFFFKIVHYYVDKSHKTESLLTCRIFSKLLFCRPFCRQNVCRRRH